MRKECINPTVNNGHSQGGTHNQSVTGDSEASNVSAHMRDSLHNLGADVNCPSQA